MHVLAANFSTPLRWNEVLKIFPIRSGDYSNFFYQLPAIRCYVYHPFGGVLKEKDGRSYGVTEDSHMTQVVSLV